MANQTLKSLHSFLQENTTTLSSGGTLKSYSHDLGSGPILCIVHGWPQSAYMWRHTIADWKSQASLFIVELPGYGFSSIPPQHDKRTVGNLIMEALHKTFPNDPSRPVIWCGHDRGGRIGHRLVVDNNPTHNIRAAVLMDIVPTTIQWNVFSNPAASAAYYHWPFLAIPTAPSMIQKMGGDEFVRINLDRAKGANDAGTAKFREDNAVEHYAWQFTNEECIRGSCGDYAAGAGEDVVEQAKDQKEGRKVKVPLLVIYSASNLGRMHDVPAAWKDWVEGEVRYEGIPDGYGHYLPEECPDRVTPLVLEWVEKHGGK